MRDLSMDWSLLCGQVSAGLVGGGEFCVSYIVDSLIMACCLRASFRTAIVSGLRVGMMDVLSSMCRIYVLWNGMLLSVMVVPFFRSSLVVISCSALLSLRRVLLVVRGNGQGYGSS